MQHQISIREAAAPADVEAIWAQIAICFERDICTDPKLQDKRAFMSDAAYRAHMQRIHDRPQDRCYYLFFCRDGRDIGFAMPVIYTSEDGKCFIAEFCVYPAFRGQGTGRACARALLDWAAAHGACYAELGYGNDDRRRRFWKSVGFVENGVDEWGEPLLLLPPDATVPITVAVLPDPGSWQLKKLENSFLAAIGEPILTDERAERLQQAIRDGRITFFVAARGCRYVGMCSVSTCFSTFGCTDIGLLEDFYIEPAFRKQGVARQLAAAAQAWSRARGLTSLTVCCAPCDEGLYRALGFEVRLGATFAHLP